MTIRGMQGFDSYHPCQREPHACSAAFDASFAAVTPPAHWCNGGDAVSHSGSVN